MALPIFYQSLKLNIMKNLIYYLWFILLLGTFTAVLGGGEQIAAFIVCYCFWGCMLAPMLSAE